MSESTAAAPAGSAISERDQRSNIVRLATAHALAGANAAVVYATGAIVGQTFAPNKALATLPISIFVVGMALCILPVGVISRRHGRRVAFLLGSGSGALAGLLAAWAILAASFSLFCAATFFGGVYAAVVMGFRFAAADGVAPARRARALSLVMAGGVFAGVLGPQLVTHTMHLWDPHLFAATFIAQAVVACLAALVLAGVRLPKPTAAQLAGGRAMREIVRQPRFITAVVCGTVSYMLMNFIMTSAPLAMHLCGLPQESANLGLQWHIIAMYAPSFFTGRLISRFGASRIVMLGLLLTGLSAIVGLGGIEVRHFWWTLILLGVGWNFGFVGASAMVLECHRPEETTRVQSLNDFVVFGTMAVGSFSSGGLLNAYGWDFVLWVSFAPLVVAILVLGLSAFTRRAALASAAGR